MDSVRSWRGVHINILGVGSSIRGGLLTQVFPRPADYDAAAGLVVGNMSRLFG